MIRSITKTILLTAAGLFLLTPTFAGSSNGKSAKAKTHVLSTSVNGINKQIVPSSIEAAPGVTMPVKGGQGFTKAPFDIDLQWQVGDTVNGVSLTGVAWTGTEFWISQWNSDTIRTLTPGGSFGSAFTVPGGPTLIRSLTWDGTSIYAGGAGQAIWEINPTTKTLTSTITMSGTVGSRMCAYDPNADNGNGGFWIGNFTSDIQLVSMTGTVLTTITQATHGIVGIYGGAVDTATAGGPYLLVYAQDGASQNTIHWIDLNTNLPTGINYDVNQDVPLAGIAGGLFVATDIIPGEQHILAMTQVAGNTLTGYELGLPPAPAGEIALSANLDGGILNHALVPADQALSGPQGLSAFAEVSAGGPFDSVQVTASLNSGAVSLASGFSTVSAPGANISTTNTFTPMAATTYTGSVDLTTSGNDTDPLNNTYPVNLTINDTVLAREGLAAGQAQLSFAANNYIGNVIQVAAQDTLTSISCYFTAGGGVTYPISASLAFLDYNTGPGTSAIFQTAPISIAASGWTTVSVPSIVLQPGTYWVGAQEQGAFLPLGTDTTVSYPGVAVGGPLGGVNIDVRDFNFFHTFLARANFGTPTTTTLTPFTLTAPADGTLLDVTGAGSQTVNITWNATTPTPAATVTYEWLLDAQGGSFASPLATVSSGTATNLTLDFTTIDNLLASLGVNIGDTVQTSWTVRASAPGAQILASAPFDLDLIRSGLLPTQGSRDFEAYTAGDLIVANDVEWAFWPGTNLDASVSNAQSNSGTNSLLIDQAPGLDLLFNCGDQTAGTWGVGFSMYIPSGNGAYYNLQETEAAGFRWPIGNVVFDPAGTGTIDVVTPPANFTFPHDQWFDVRNYVDLDNDTFQVWINNNLVLSGQWTAAPPQGGGTAGLQLGAVNIFPEGAPGTNPANKVFYLDDMYLQPDSLRSPVTYTFTPFDLTSPPDGTRLVVAANDPTPVTITWNATTTTPSATPSYQWQLDLAGNPFNPPLLDFTSDNGGLDPQITLTSGAIDTELANRGLQPGDSIVADWTVVADVFGQTANAANGPFGITIVRDTVSSLSSAFIANKVRFYPNPTNGELIIEVEDNVVETVIIQNMIGQELRTFDNVESRNVLDVSDLSSGLYLVRFISKDGDYSQKLVIE